jgi:hypothetical protein
MVLLLMLGVLYVLLPVANAIPPVGAAYQSTVSNEEGVAEILTLPEPQRNPLPAVGALGIEMIKAVMAFLVEEVQLLIVLLLCA